MGWNTLMTRPQKYRDVTRFLRSRGWERTRQRGSHETWSPAGGGATVTLVQHRGEVSPGVVRQLQAVFADTPSDWNRP